VVAAVNGVVAFGHWGRPVLAFPAERGDAGEFERRGMVAAIGDLLAATSSTNRGSCTTLRTSRATIWNGCARSSVRC
jgi:hypothetical protein